MNFKYWLEFLKLYDIQTFKEILSERGWFNVVVYYLGVTILMFIFVLPMFIIFAFITLVMKICEKLIRRS